VSQQTSKIGSIKSLLQKIQSHKGYMIPYWIIYAYLMLNESIKLFFFPKWADIPFNILTSMCGVLYIIDICFRCFLEVKYFPRFFFFTDIASILFIFACAFIENISYWITLSFLKIIMVVRITNILMAYKEWNRARKNKKKAKQE
jgi:hypothetical protein